MMQTELIEYAILGIQRQLDANLNERQRLLDALNDLQKQTPAAKMAARTNPIPKPPAEPAPAPKARKRKPKISAEGRERIAAAQRARWAARKKEAAPEPEIARPPMPRHTRRGGLVQPPPASVQ